MKTKKKKNGAIWKFGTEDDEEDDDENGDVGRLCEWWCLRTEQVFKIMVRDNMHFDKASCSCVSFET